MGYGFGKAAFAGKTSNGMPSDRNRIKPPAQTTTRSRPGCSRAKPRSARLRRSAGVTVWPSTSRAAGRARLSAATASAAASRLDLAPPRRSARIAAASIAAARKQLGTALAEPACASRAPVRAEPRSPPRGRPLSVPPARGAGREPAQSGRRPQAIAWPRGERLGAPDFARQLTRSVLSRSATRLTARPARTDPRGRRQDTPRPAVELDRQPAALPLARGPRRHVPGSRLGFGRRERLRRHLRLAVALLDLLDGDRQQPCRRNLVRAELGLDLLRIPCTSGCSRRKAVAF